MSQWIKSIIETASYTGVGLLMFLENVFPPIPSELIMPLAGFVSTQGELSLAGVVISGTLGSLMGAIALYYLGRYVGPARLRRFCEKYGRWIGLFPQDLDRSDAWFKRYGGRTVLISRVVPGVRSLISIPAGLSSMRMSVFVIYTTIGSAIWTAALAVAGRLLGQNYERVEHWIGPVSTAVVAGIVLTLVVRGFRSRRVAR